jgi:uncharacterized protein YjbJ (UPF0337 family)
VGSGSQFAPRWLISNRARPNPHPEYKVKGKIKQAAGGLSGDKKLEREGKMDEAKGKVKGAVEDVKHTVKNAVKQ